MTQVGFHHEFVVASPPDEALRSWLSTFMGSFGVAGYHLTTHTTTTVAFERRYTPRWARVVAIVSAVFTWGLSLLLFLVHEEERLHAHFAPHAGGTLVSLTGTTVPEVADAMARLTEEMTQRSRVAAG